MMITKIELENITSHKKTKIEFQKGLNVLLGQNGTGKSSVLNMIGYALFDFIPGTQKDHLRYDSSNPKSGEVNVWIINNDDDEFKIRRTLGRQSNIIEVTDTRTGTILGGVNNKTSLIEWLKRQISLKQEFDLNNIFKTSIGVPQGTFTAPFLLTPTNRKTIFDPILQVETYRLIQKRLYEVMKINNEQIQLFEVKAGKITGILTQKEDLNSEKETVKKEIKDNKEKESKLKKEFEELNSRYNELKKIQEQIEDLIRVKDNLNVKRENFKINIDKLESEIKDAQNAQEICKKTEGDYKEHQMLIETEQQKQNVFEEFQQSLNEKSNLDKQLAEIENSNEVIIARIKEIEERKVSNYEKLKHNYDEYQNLLELIQNKQEIVTTFNVQEELLNKERSHYTDLSIDIDNREKKIGNLPELEKEVEKLESLNSKYNILEEKRIRLEVEIQYSIDNKNKSKAGNCPILNTKCKNVDDNSLEEIFENQIKEKNQILKPLLKDLEKLKKEVEELEPLHEELEKMKGLEVEINTLKTQKLDLGQKIQKIKTEIINRDSEVKELSTLKSRKSTIEEHVDEYYILKNDIEKVLPEQIEKYEKAQNAISPILSQIKQLETKILQNQNIEEDLKKIREKMNKTRDNFLTFQSYIKLAQKLPELEKEFNNYKSSLKNIESSIKKEEDKKSKLEAKFSTEDFNDLEKQKNILNDEIKVLEGTINSSRKRIEDINEKLKSLEEEERELKKIEQDLKNLEYLKTFVETLRNLYSELGPKITEALLKRINGIASEIFRDLMDIENVDLIWEKDYNIQIQSSDSSRDFHQLSGGEQMAAALSVRLAILKILTNIDFAFFDEPTINLDKERRVNLARTIQNIKGFQQIFVISHDDTFEENAENVIRFFKDENEITTTLFLSK